MLQSKESVNTARMLCLSICTWSVRRGVFRKAKTTRPFCYMAPKHRGQLNTTALTQLFSMRWVSDSSIINQSRTNYPNMMGIFLLSREVVLPWGNEHGFSGKLNHLKWNCHPQQQDLDLTYTSSVLGKNKKLTTHNPIMWNVWMDLRKCLGKTYESYARSGSEDLDFPWTMLIVHCTMHI